MSFLFNPQPSHDCHDKFSDVVDSNIGDLGFPFDSHTFFCDFIDDSGLFAAPNFLQNPPPSETVDFLPFHPCALFSDSQTLSVDNPEINYPWHQRSQVHSFSDPTVFHHPSEPVAQPSLDLDRYTTMSSLLNSNSRYLSKQAIHHGSNDIDAMAKRVYGILDDQPSPQIILGSSLIRNETTDVLQPWFNQESIADCFTEPHDRKPGVALTVSSRAHVGGSDCSKAQCLIKRKSVEGERREEEQVKRSNVHQCKLCNMSFRTGNALGGHMSYHAKKKKLEALKLTGPPSELAFARALASGFRGSVNLSTNTFKW